jgi:hypothetical protein
MQYKNTKTKKSNFSETLQRAAPGLEARQD